MSLMSDPVVVTGLGILGIPPLPDTALIGEHAAVLAGAARHHQMLLQDAGPAIRLAGANEGPAAEAAHVYLTGGGGPQHQTTDLADRFAVAAAGLVVSQHLVEWIGTLLAGAAVAAVVAVAFAPHLLPRVTALARRFLTFLRDALSRIGRVFAALLRSPQARRIDTVAGRLHDTWRAARRLPDGGYEPRIKTTVDQAWIRRNGTDQVDIANTRYRDLPVEWQKENKESATVAVRLVADARKRGDDLTSDEFMEQASEQVHIAWLRRNGEWAPPEQRLPYRELSHVEKEKDRVVVREALDA
ncbi:hypothetical protein ACGF0J_12090 [Nonomuraea sp. NPDC047897]|uniref:hypothetical protein n=1 Tax=Nonomuraea sp. NPDC047897 TaxID=3364346 RepID=UPI0037212C44